MATKYIVDNVSGQTINGNLTINGDLNVTGSTSGGVKTYKALLTQTGPLSGTDISAFNNNFIIGETYAIVSYSAGDDFSNIADLQSGTMNNSGCVFIATGTTPTDWSNGSSLGSQGDLLVNVLENSLGFNLDWSAPPYLNNASYVATNTSAQGDNTIPPTKTIVTSSIGYVRGPLSSTYPDFYTPIAYITNDNWLNDTIQIDFWNNTIPVTIASDSAYDTPITITIYD